MPARPSPAPDSASERLRGRLHVALRVGGEQQHFEQLVVGQALGPGGDHPLAQSAAMAVIMRHAGRRLSELILPLLRGVREGHPLVLAVLQRVGAIDIIAQRPHPIMIGCVEDPDALRLIPDAAETACSGGEVRVIGGADDDAAVPLNDRERHPTPARLSMPMRKARIGIVNMALISTRTRARDAPPLIGLARQVEEREGAVHVRRHHRPCGADV